MKSKKSQAYIIGVVILVVIMLGWGYTQVTYNYRIKSGALSSPMGQKQSSLVQTYQRAEDDLFYLDYATKYSFYNTILDMASAGGIHDNTACGEHLFNLWNNEEAECYPDFESQATDFLNLEINSRLNKIETNFPHNNYDYEFQQETNKLTLYGLAKQKISYGIGRTTGMIDMTQDFIFPVQPNSDGTISLSSCYGDRVLNGKADYHDGIDIKINENQNVLAIADGTVQEICEEWTGACACSLVDEDDLCENYAACDHKCGNYGNYIIIKHSDNLYSRYSHLADVAPLQEGQNITKGTTIGKTGNTGLSFGPHIDTKIYDSPDFGPDLSKSPLCFFSEDQISKIRFATDADSCKAKYDNDYSPNKNDPDLQIECGKISSTATLPTQTATNPDEEVEGESTSTDPCSFSVKLEEGQEPRLDEGQVNRILENTPLKDLGYYFVGKSQETSVDDSFALAMLTQESGLGKAGAGVRNKNVGNLRVPSRCTETTPTACSIETINGVTRKRCSLSCTDYPLVKIDCPEDLDVNDRSAINTKCFAVFDMWEDGISAWYDLISGSVYFGQGLTTIETIIPKYAPAADDNAVNPYIQNVRNSMSSYGINVPVCQALTGYSGFYSIEPHFTTQASFDKSIYEKLTDFAKEIVEECSTDNPEQCLNEKITEFNELEENKNQNIELSRNCEDNELYYDFTEKYYDCLANKQEDCVCRISYSEVEGKTFKVQFIENEMSLSGHENEQTFYFKNPTVTYSDNPDSQSKEYNSLEYEVEFNNNNEFEQAQILRPGVVPFDIHADTLLLYKSSENEIIFVSEEGEKSECIDNKYRYALCLETNNKIPNPKNSLEPETVKIRFALELGDTTPPDPITGFEAVDLGNGVIAMKWTPSTADDLLLYKVYYAEEDMAALEKENIESFDLKIDYDESYTSLDWNGATCSLFPIPVCTFIAQDITQIPFNTDLEMGAYHSLSQENKLFYLWNPPISKPHNVAITAVDVYGNEIEVPAGFSPFGNYLVLE